MLGVLEDTLLREGWMPGAAGAGPGSPLTLPSALSWFGFQGHGGQDGPSKALRMGWGCSHEITGLQSRVRQAAWTCGQEAWGPTGRAGQPQTNVAWCGLALGLAGPPRAGLRLGKSDAGDLLACDLRGPVRTPEILRPSLGAEPATRSTSMIVLTGRPRLLWAPPPVTGRRERLSPVCPTALQTPRAGDSPHPPALHRH